MCHRYSRDPWLYHSEVQINIIWEFGDVKDEDQKVADKEKKYLYQDFQLLENKYKSNDDSN